MAWMINDVEAAITLGYLERLYKLEPSPTLKKWIETFRKVTENNQGKEL